MNRETRRRRRRWPFWLAIAIVLLAAVYSGGWFVVARYAGGEAASFIATANGEGRRLSCENNRIVGFPLGMGLSCDSFLAEHAADGISFSGGAFRAGAQVYDPALIVGDLEGEARLELRGLEPLAFDWEMLRVDSRLDAPVPKHVAVTTRAFAAYLAGDSASRKEVLSIGDFSAKLAPVGEALNLTAVATGLALDRALTEGRELPPLNGLVEVSLDRGREWFAGGAGSLRGQAGSLRNAVLSVDPQTSISASGTFAVDESGLLDADMTLTVRGAGELSQIVSGAFPESAGEIESFAASLQALGENAQLPLRVVKGQVRYGFFDLGDIPPLP